MTHPLPDKAVEAGARFLCAEMSDDWREGAAYWKNVATGFVAALAAEGLVVVRVSDHKSLDAVCEALLVLAEGWKDEGKDETAIALSSAAVLICGRDRTRQVARAQRYRAMIAAAQEG